MTMSSSTYTKPEIKTNFSNIPTIIYILFVIVFYGFGLYAMIDYITNPVNQELLNTFANDLGSLIHLSIGFLPLLISFVIVFIVITLFLSYIIVWLMSKIAEEVTIVVAVLFPLLLIGIGIVATISTILVGSIFVLIGVLMLALVLWKFQALRRSGKFVEFCATMVIDEKAVLWMPILIGIFSIITGIFMSFGFLKLNDLVNSLSLSSSQTNQALGFIVSIIVEYIYLVVYLGLYYSLSAGVVSYALDWYRGLDPDIRSAIKDVKQTFPIILKFAFMMATVRIILSVFRQAGRDVARQSKNIGAALVLALIGEIIVSIIGAVWAFLNFFTLISIIQNKRNLTESIKDSAGTMYDNFLDVIIGETGYGLTMFIFAIVNALIWIIVGFFIGWAAFPTGLSTFIPSRLIMSIIVAFLFFVMSFFPYSIVTMPMGAAFKSFLYSYAKDSSEGFVKPSKLPVELRDTITNLSTKQKKRRMRNPTQYF